MEEELLSSSQYKYKLLSNLTNSDLADFILDKYEEKESLEFEKKLEMKKYKKENKELCWLIFDDYIKVVEKIIWFFKFELKNRDVTKKDDYNMQEKIQEAKNWIWIVTLIESITGINVNTKRNMKCFLPSHKDRTASFKAYENTESRHCFGCHKGGDIVNFVQDYYNITRKEAMLKIIHLNK